MNAERRLTLNWERKKTWQQTHIVWMLRKRPKMQRIQKKKNKNQNL